MEKSEKLVMELKRCMLASRLKMDTRDIDSLLEFDLISQACALQIKGMKTARDRAGILVDKLLDTHDPLAFPTFIRAMCSRYPDVMDELRLELQCQQGNIYVGPKVTAHCKSVSSRQILTSRGLCEYDKRRFVRLLSVRSQLAQLVWQRRVERTEEEAEDIRSAGLEHEAFINALATNIHAFLQEHKEPIAEHGLSHMMLSTSDFLRHLDQSACSALNEQVDNVIKFAERVCLQRDKLIEERKEAMSVLGGRYNVNMVDLAVERIVHQWVKDMLECKQRIGELDRHIRELSNEIKTLEMIGPYQMKRRQRTIEELEGQLEKKLYQEEHLDTVVSDMSAKMAVIRKQHGDYGKHIDLLLSDRRLQYIYARENRRLPGKKRMRPEIKTYMNCNRRTEPMVRYNGVIPKKIIFKSSPRSVKSKSISPRPVARSKSTLTPRSHTVTPRSNTLHIKTDGDSFNLNPRGCRPRTARVRTGTHALTHTSPSGTLIPYEKEPGRSTKRFLDQKEQGPSTKRFLDQSFNVHSTERQMSKLKV